MIAVSLRPVGHEWGTISFASTLYLGPILDLLLEQVHHKWQPELRLGLQEALVNAVKHGNNLDPSKKVKVQFLINNNEYCWIISDEGDGFRPPCIHQGDQSEILPSDDSENGRGLCILHLVFDQVHWNRRGTELSLCKQVNSHSRLPLFS